MTDQDRAAQAWNGPWKCEKCGNKPFVGIVAKNAIEQGWHLTAFTGPFEECTGKLIPYDRRNPSRAAYGQEQFRAGVEAIRDDVPRFTDDYGDTYIKLEDLEETADKLLAEQEKKV